MESGTMSSEEKVVVDMDLLVMGVSWISRVGLGEREREEEEDCWTDWFWDGSGEKVRGKEDPEFEREVEEELVIGRFVFFKLKWKSSVILRRKREVRRIQGNNEWGFKRICELRGRGRGIRRR